MQSFNVGDKATGSRDRTQVLWDQAHDADRVTRQELGPRLQRAQQQLEEVSARTRTTKDHVEEINRCVRDLADVRAGAFFFFFWVGEWVVTACWLVVTSCQKGFILRQPWDNESVDRSIEYCIIEFSLAKSEVK